MFIDGVSFKNDVCRAALVGQDSSRGNPFPQNAVQEFRVITQNYSAQYDHASSAIITAVTKSGGNDFDGQRLRFLPAQAVGVDDGRRASNTRRSTNELTTATSRAYRRRADHQGQAQLLLLL